MGTGVFGAGIYLAGQVFHMAEHWPAALLLWAAGAAVGVVLLRQWPQVLWLAVLAPAWLWGEWMTAHAPPHGLARPDAGGGRHVPACLRVPDGAAGGIDGALAPRARLARRDRADSGGGGARDGGRRGTRVRGRRYQREVEGAARWLAWVGRDRLPLALAWLLRGRDAVWMLAALAWALLLAQVSPRTDAGELAMYALLAIGAAGIVLWGLRDGQRLAVNVGVLGFALAMLGFYFASLYDRFGRALGLIGLGVLFIGGGWLLERARRRLIARLPERRP